MINQAVYYVPKHYANVNQLMPKEYWDYDNFKITQWG